MTMPVVLLSQEFLKILPFTLKQEAPYPSNWGNPRNFSNTPGDPGGATMDGIIQTEYDRKRAQWGLPLRSVRLCSEDEGDLIYYTDYYLPYCPKLDPGLDLQFFDPSVNEGPVEAVMILQYALGTPVDGLWGPATQTKLDAVEDIPALIRAMGARRSSVYRATRNFTRFGADWLRRTSEITTNSLGLAGTRA